MSDPMHTTTDQLDSLLREGKISESDYERLREALDSRSGPTEEELAEIRAGGEGTDRGMPAVLWVGLVSLAIMVLLKIAFAPFAGGFLLIDAALSAGLLVGLYLGHKWAYVLTIIFCVLGTALGFRVGPAQGLGTFVLDCLVLVPVLLSTRYFFPQHEQTEENEL